MYSNPVFLEYRDHPQQCYENEGEGKCMDYNRNEKVHVRVSVDALALITIELRNKAPFTLLQVTNAQWHNHL
jgi:hypothetical protein